MTLPNKLLFAQQNCLPVSYFITIFHFHILVTALNCIFQAVCCSDREHCCPKGYTCDTAQGSCSKSLVAVPWSKKLPARPLSTVNTPVQCADNKTQCLAKNTCCLDATSHFACCPLENVSSTFITWNAIIFRFSWRNVISFDFWKFSVQNNVFWKLHKIYSPSLYGMGQST